MFHLDDRLITLPPFACMHVSILLYRPLLEIYPNIFALDPPALRPFPGICCLTSLLHSTPSALRYKHDVLLGQTAWRRGKIWPIPLKLVRFGATSHMHLEWIVRRFWNSARQEKQI